MTPHSPSPIPLSATDVQPHDTGKVDPPNLMGKQTLIEERIENYAITNLPNEMIEMILADVVNSSENSTETYAILSQTCSRFNDILKRKKDAFLSHIHIKCPESVFDSLPHFHDKIKVSFRKIMKIFGPNREVATSLAEIVDDRKWRSVWVVTNLAKHSWYIIELYYWKLNEKAILSEEKKDKLYWLKNDLCPLHFQDEEMLWSPTAWLNNRIMDATQKVICKKLGADDDYQSVLNVKNRRGTAYRKINISNYFMMVLDTGYLLFVAMERSTFVTA